MKDLTNLCNYINENIDYLVDFISSIDVCYVWRCRGRYKPYISWAHQGSIQEKDFPIIKNYTIWLYFFCDYDGYDVLVYYPKNVKKGDRIKVLFKGLYIEGFIHWIHGDLGLFSEMIHPLLYLDKLPPNHIINNKYDECIWLETKENYTDIVKQYAEYDNTFEINTLIYLVFDAQLSLMYLN
tara:strand:+ start:121 stop:666 length:546 start_codon:yes stop_codon:yes gene_type:complete